MCLSGYLLKTDVHEISAEDVLHREGNRLADGRWLLYPLLAKLTDCDAADQRKGGRGVNKQKKCISQLLTMTSTQPAKYSSSVSVRGLGEDI